MTKANPIREMLLRQARHSARVSEAQARKRRKAKKEKRDD